MTGCGHQALARVAVAALMIFSLLGVQVTEAEQRQGPGYSPAKTLRQKLIAGYQSWVCLSGYGPSTQRLGSLDERWERHRGYA